MKRIDFLAFALALLLAAACDGFGDESMRYTYWAQDEEFSNPDWDQRAAPGEAVNTPDDNPGEEPAADPQAELSGADVFLFIGQSNMAGRGYLIDGDEEPIPGCYLLGDGDIPITAKAPMNYYSTVLNGKGNEAVNPAFSFCKVLREKTGKDILIISNARGGTSLDQWMKGAEAVAIKNGSVVMFDEAVRRVKAAQKYGSLKGIMWHQGESGSYTAASYMKNLTQFVSDLRSDMGISESDAIFVAGQLGTWQSRAGIYNPMIKEISSKIPNSDWVSSEGCAQRYRDDGAGGQELDPQHFNRDAQITLGKRYAQKVLKAVYNIDYDPETDTTKY